MPEQKPSKRMSRSEWAKTPYARSEAKNPDASVYALLTKYGVADIQWTQCKGPHGRAAITLRFILHERGYRIAMESLDADASSAELIIQIKRAVYFYVKATLEVTSVFVSPEEALFAFLELENGATTYEVAGPKLGLLKAPDFMQRLLPGA